MIWLGPSDRQGWVMIRTDDEGRPSMFARHLCRVVWASALSAYVSEFIILPIYGWRR